MCFICEVISVSCLTLKTMLVLSIIFPMMVLLVLSLLSFFYYDNSFLDYLLSYLYYIYIYIIIYSDNEANNVLCFKFLFLSVIHVMLLLSLTKYSFTCGICCWYPCFCNILSLMFLFSLCSPMCLLFLC